MSSDSTVPERVQAEIRDQLRSDRESGRFLTKDRYRSRWPGYETVVDQEWDALEAFDPDATIAHAPATDSPEAETRLLGHFRLEEELGRGGQGVVYRAFDTRLDREVALKILFGPTGGEELPLEVKRELEALSRLDHPGLCVIHDAGRIEGQVYIAMRFVRGRPLADHIHEEADRRSDRPVED